MRVINGKTYLTSGEAAARLSMSPKTLLRWIERPQAAGPLTKLRWHIDPANQRIRYFEADSIEEVSREFFAASDPAGSVTDTNSVTTGAPTSETDTNSVTTGTTTSETGVRPAPSREARQPKLFQSWDDAGSLARWALHVFIADLMPDDVSALEKVSAEHRGDADVYLHVEDETGERVRRLRGLRVLTHSQELEDAVRRRVLGNRGSLAWWHQVPQMSSAASSHAPILQGNGPTEWFRRHPKDLRGFYDAVEPLLKADPKLNEALRRAVYLGRLTDADGDEDFRFAILVDRLADMETIAKQTDKISTCLADALASKATLASKAIRISLVHFQRFDPGVSEALAWMGSNADEISPLQGPHGRVFHDQPLSKASAALSLEATDYAQLEQGIEEVAANDPESGRLLRQTTYLGSEDWSGRHIFWLSIAVAERHKVEKAMRQLNAVVARQGARAWLMTLNPKDPEHARALEWKPQPAGQAVGGKKHNDRRTGAAKN